jgi:hypothetical protein
MCTQGKPRGTLIGHAPQTSLAAIAASTVEVGDDLGRRVPNIDHFSAADSSAAVRGHCA